MATPRRSWRSSRRPCSATADMSWASKSPRKGCLLRMARSSTSSTSASRSRRTATRRRDAGRITPRISTIRSASSRSTSFGQTISAKLVDRELAERIVEIRGVIRPASRLLVAVRRLLEALVDEVLLRAIRNRHPLRGLFDAHDISAVAEQGLLELRQLRLGVAIAEPLLDHHLLAIVRPPFDVRSGGEELAGL